MKKSKAQKAFDREWRAQWQACMICGGTSCDPHHKVPKSHFAHKGEYLDEITLYTGETIILNAPSNVCALCREHHEDFHNIMGQVFAISAGKRTVRIENAKSWFLKYPPTLYPESRHALPVSALEEMLDEGEPREKEAIDV